MWHVAAEILAVSSQSFTHYYLQAETKASSLLLQMIQKPKQPLSPSMFRQVVQLCHGKLFLVRDSLPESLKTKPICWSDGSSISSSVLCVRPGAGIPSTPSLSDTALSCQSCAKCPWKCSQSSCSPAASPQRSQGLVHAWKLIWIKGWCELQAEWESQNISGQNKTQVIKAVDGRVFKVSLFLHPHINKPDTTL